jgi:hypothetical protein
LSVRQAPEVVVMFGVVVIFGAVALKVVVAVEVGRLEAVEEFVGIKLVVVDVKNNKDLQRAFKIVQLKMEIQLK